MAKKAAGAAPKLNMFETESELQAALDLAISDDGVASDESIGYWNSAYAMLEAAFNEAEDKRDAVAYKIQQMEADADQMKAYSKMFSARAAVHANKAKRLKDMVLAVVISSGQKELSGKAFKLALRRNPDKVDITDQSVLPESMLRSKLVVEPDKIAIRDAIEAGEDVPGAWLMPGEERLDIKAR